MMEKGINIQSDMSQIFLSYRRTDTHIMQRVRDDLRANGFTAWTDETLTPGTESWQREIEKAIEAADALVVTLSPDAKDSEWVRREINYANSQSVRIFPLVARGEDKDAIPFSLIEAQYADIRKDYRKGMQQLIHGIFQHIGGAAPAHIVVGAHPGRDEEQQVSISLLEAYYGMAKKIIHTGGETLIGIPKGAATGTRVRLSGKGEPGVNGGKAGDLLLTFQVELIPQYERKGDDLYVSVQVGDTLTNEGGEVEVSTLDGSVNLKIPLGTKSGQKFRLRGKGMPVLYSDGPEYGDLYVQVAVRDSRWEGWLPNT
jgi:curved DNA-binding protein CbpA